MSVLTEGHPCAATEPPTPMEPRISPDPSPLFRCPHAVHRCQRRANTRLPQSSHPAGLTNASRPDRIFVDGMTTTSSMHYCSQNATSPNSHQTRPSTSPTPSTAETDNAPHRHGTRAQSEDRINASRILRRGLGKCPKQAPAAIKAPTSQRRGATRIGRPSSEPKSPRLVTQLQRPPSTPSAPLPAVTTGMHSPNQTPLRPLVPTLRRRRRHSRVHRNLPSPRSRRSKTRAVSRRMLIDRIMGMKPTPFTNVVHPEAQHSSRRPAFRKKTSSPWKKRAYSPPTPTHPYRHLQLQDAKRTGYAKEEAAAFTEIDLKIERQRKWPEIEEYGERSSPRYTPHTPTVGPPDT